jgi:tetratricopeptide (TPR) repeat protein
MKKTLLLLLSVCSLSVSAASAGLDTLKVSLPSLHWALQLSLPGFEQKDMDLNNQMESRYISAYNDSLDLYVSIGMEENANHFNNSREMRDSGWVKLKYFFDERQAVVLDSAHYESGDCALSDYYVASVGGIVVRQRNLIAYIFRNNVCITIQLIKSNYTDADTENFNKVLSNIRITAPYTHVSIEQFIDGTIYLNKENYQLASRTLQKALDLDQTDHLLTKEQLYWLISNLGLAYGQSGQIGRAVSVLNSGISADPYFPVFYYNLAYIYARVDNLTETIYYLLQANLYKKNMPKGERLPNPTKDPLFEKYWKNPKFKEALKAM